MRPPVLLAAALLGTALLASSPPAAAGEGEGCGVCHGAERVQHEGSVHRGALLGCVACHGGDPVPVESKAAAHSAEKGFRGRIPRTALPEACGSCHADAARMRPYGLRSDALQAYRTSHHGRAVLEEGKEDAATCTDCHGVHDVLRVKDPRSPAYRTRVPATCGKCHADEAMMERHGLTTAATRQFAGSIHGLRLSQGEPGVPSCASCHDAHAAAPPGAMEVAAVCGACHTEARDLFRESPHFRASLAGGMNQCVTCHGNHAVEHPDYGLFDAPAERGNGTHGAVCLSCHADPGDPGAAVARAFGKGLRDVEASIAATADRVEAVAGRGFFVDDEREALAQARREVIRTIPLTHTADLARFEGALRRARSFVDEASKGCDDKVRQFRDRKIYGSFAALALLGVAGFFALRRRRVKAPVGP